MHSRDAIVECRRKPHVHKIEVFILRDFDYIA